MSAYDGLTVGLDVNNSAPKGILFVDANSKLSNDVANFSYDSTAKRLTVFQVNVPSDKLFMFGPTSGSNATIQWVSSLGYLLISVPANNASGLVLSTNGRFNCVWDSAATTGSMLTLTGGHVWLAADETGGTGGNLIYGTLSGDYNWGAHMNMTSAQTGSKGFVAGCHGVSNVAFLCVVDDTNNTSQALVVYQGGTNGSSSQDLIRLNAREKWQDHTLQGAFTGTFFRCRSAQADQFVVSSSGTLSTYNGQVTSGIGVPSILYYLSFPGQSASIGTTTLITPAATGIYRVSVYLETTTAGSAGTVTSTFGWTDDTQAETVTTGTLSLTTKGFLQASYFIRALTAVAITGATTVAGATGSPVYTVNYVIERIA